MLSLLALHWLPILLFIVVFACILLEVVDKSLVAVLGAVLFIVLGLMPQTEVTSVLHFETICLLLGMMILVEIATASGLFELLSLCILKITQGQPLLIFLLLMLNTILLSSVMNNVTTVLIVVPLTIEITRGIGLNSRTFVIGEIILANTGGLLTLIGDPVNTIVGSYAAMGMVDFIVGMSVPVLLHAGCMLAAFYFFDRKQFQAIGDNFIKMFHNQLVIRSVEQKFVMKKIRGAFVLTASVPLVFTLLSFFFVQQLQFTAGLLAIIGAAVSLLINHRSADMATILRQIDWKTLIFFSGLFVMVGGVERTGALDAVAESIATMSASPAILIGVLLLVTAIVSAFIDNVPFVTVMLPVIAGIQSLVHFDHVHVLWLTLCLGAVFGGLITPFGSSANIVAIGLCRRLNIEVPTPVYLRFSLPVSLSGLFISYFYLLAIA